MIETVVFDLDDTLYDEVDYCKSGFEAVAQCLAQSSPSLRSGEIFDLLWAEFTSGNRDKIFNKTLQKLELSSGKGIIDSLVEIYRLHKPQLTLPPQSRNVLENLSKKYNLALLTDGYMPAQQFKVEALGITDYFKCIVYTELLGRENWKPSPAGFEKICTELATPFDKCVYVADNLKKDFIAPNILGFAASIQVIRPNHLHEYKAPSKDAQPSHIITDLDELSSLLESI